MRPGIETGLLAGAVPEAQQWELAEGVKTLAGRIASAGSPTAIQVRNACAALNQARQFELCRLLAQAWHDCPPADIAIVKHLAQALINLSLLDQAQALLDQTGPEWSNTPDSPVRQRELPELDGLAARIRKQRFVDDQDEAQLLAAHDGYLQVYNAKHLYWHGVNVVALRARAERDGYPIAGENAATLAHRIYNAELPKLGQSPWQLATLSELSLAMGLCDEAELWLYRLVHDPACTAFMLDSYGRQLREIWQGRPMVGGTQCADRLATIIARHEMAQLSALSFTPESARGLVQAGLEKVFSNVGSFSVDMVRRMLDVCQSIGCVCNKQGVRLGTGFVLQASDLGGEGEGLLFVTNAHVISDTVPGAIPVAEAQVSFELGPDASGKPVFHAVAELIYTSAPADLGSAHKVCDFLDVTIVRLADMPGCIKGLTVARGLPRIDGDSRAYVIGHPQGSGLQVSVHDSQLLACDEPQRLIHYRTPTDPGSSGSPVFNEEWKIIALHHGGSHKAPRLMPPPGVYQANEGVTLLAIRAGLGVHRRSSAGN